jgi:hypothetical protein
MSTRTDDRAARRRAEARRRARLAARGELPPEPDEEPVAETTRDEGGFLRRLFPKAPPLPGRPDPLAGFDPSGPLRPVRERLFLLRRNVVAWTVTGILAFMGNLASIVYEQSLPFLSLVGTFVLFGSLIGAGWFGWQRPTLYGTAAAILGFAITTATVVIAFASAGVPLDTFGPNEISGLLLRTLYLAGLGFLGGWYGGYLRRRQTQLATETRRRR